MALRCTAKATFFACMFLAFLFQETCEAAEWSATPSMQLREDYDSNVLLTTQPHSGERSTWATPKLDFGVASDIWQVGGEASYTRRRFPGDSSLNSDAQNLSLGSSYRTEREIWQLSASSSKVSYLAEGTITSNTGVFTQNISSDTNTISPSWTWLMTELTQLQLTYSQSDVSFVNGQSSGLFNYRSSVGSANLSYPLDNHTQIFLTSAYSIFRVPTTTFESKTSSYQVGATRTFSETTKATFAVGGRNTLSEQNEPTCLLFFGPSCLVPGPQITVSSRSSSSIFNASLDKQFETVHVTAAASRSYEPSGTGQELRTDYVSLSFSKPFTEKLSGNLAVVGYKINSDVGSFATLYDSRVYQVQPGLSWPWATGWELDMSYSYTHLQRISETAPATRNAAYLTLTYKWPKMSISR